jgi:hypothetical protein
MLTEILSLVSMEVLVFLVYAQALICLTVESSTVTTIDPYIPQAKHPPLYLGPFLNWLNATIDLVVDRIVPCMSGRARHFSTCTTRQDKRSPIVIRLSWFNVTLRVRDT